MGVTEPPMDRPIWNTMATIQRWELWVPRVPYVRRYHFGTIYSTGGPWPQYRASTTPGSQAGVFNTLDEAKAWLIATWRLES